MAGSGGQRKCDGLVPNYNSDSAVWRDDASAGVDGDAPAHAMLSDRCTESAWQSVAGLEGVGCWVHEFRERDCRIVDM